MLERVIAWARTPAGKAVIALFVLGLVLRLIAVAVVDPDPRDGRFDDSVWYDSAARHLAAGDGYVFDPSVWSRQGVPLFPDDEELSATALWPPGYPLALASVYRISGDSVTAGRLLNALCGAATILVVFAIARKLFGETEAIFAATLMALFPASIYFTPLIMSETLFVFLLSSTLAFFLYFVLDRDDPPPYAVVASGVLAGLTAMTHFEFIAFPAVMLTLVALQLGVRRVAVPAGLLVVGFALVVSPWALRNRITMGETIVASTQVGRLAVQGHHPLSEGEQNLEILAIVDQRFARLPRTERELKVNSEGLYMARTFAWDHKLEELRLLPRRIYGLFRSDEAAITWAQSDKPVYGEETGKRLRTLCAFVFYSTIALALVSWPFWFRWRDRRRWLLFAPVPYVTFMFGVLLAGDPGYHVGMYPSLIVLASPALAVLWRITNDSVHASFDRRSHDERSRPRLQTRR